MTVEPNYYELLGVESNSTTDDIKTAFRQQAFRNHPDQGGNPALFRMLENAYATLSSPSKRAEYDKTLKAPWSSSNNNDDEDLPTGTYGVYEDAAHFANREPQFADENRWPGAENYANRPAPHVVQPQFSRPEARSHTSWKLLMWACLWGIVILSLIGVSILPGVGALALSAVLITLMLVWLMGSLILRFAGWFLVLSALYSAHWHDASPVSTVVQIATGFGIWLCGHWFYTFKCGQWNSVVAFGVLSKLPTYLRPDRRFINSNITHSAT